MKYKRSVYTPVLLIITTAWFTTASQDLHRFRGLLEKYNHASKLERIVAMWNRSSDSLPPPRQEEPVNLSVPSFSSEVSRCIEEHQFQITENYSQGKSIILNCFKTSLMLTILGKYLGDSSKPSIKLFNGLLEFKKIPERECPDDNCDLLYNRNFGSHHSKKDEYVRMYKKAMQKLIDQRKKFHSYRNMTEEERTKQLNRIDANSQAFLSEVVKYLGNEEVEKMEEEKLKKEILDPKLLSMLDALSRNYMLRLKFYPGVSARMMRSTNGGFTFDLEIPETEEIVEEDTSSNESLTREMKNESVEYVDSSENSIRRRRVRPKGKGNAKKKFKKKVKKLKKVLPYLLLPMVIQLSLLPLVFKKLFFLAMKALIAGKVALILVAFNLLKNSCEHRDDFQKIRVEHYGYRRGEEYGAWINGRRSMTVEPSYLSEEPYRAYRPTS